MTQLTYNEAFDPYHAAFRFLRLHLGCDLSTKVHFDKLRILDFYLLFPFRLQSMKLMAGDTGWRKTSKSYEDRAPYGMMPDDLSVFARMEPFQRAAAASLVHSGHISAEGWEYSEVAFTDETLPETVVDRCNDLNNHNDEIVKILCAIKARYPVGGRDGLKDRSGLMEYRYDPI